MKEIHDPQRMRLAPPVPQTLLQAHFVAAGMLSLDPTTENLEVELPETPPAVTESAASPLGSTSHPSISSATPLAASFSGSAATESSLKRSHGDISRQLAKQRVEEAAEESQPPAKRARQARTCCKCGLSDCPGKGGAGFKSCRNYCRDCGKPGSDFSCTGRNTKKPNYTCTGERISDK